jgi:periplasmic mercuric ion binding protein
MRQLAVLTMFVAAISFVQADQGAAVMCKADNLHLCCNQCDKSVRGILDKVEGISAVKVDRKADDKVTFQAKDEKAASAALAALVKGGFLPTVTAGDKKLIPEKVTVNVKGDEITVTGVHVCCGACVKAVTALFTDAKVTVPGSGTMRDVIVSGKNLDGQAVLETMQKGGFTGTVQAKK